MVVGLLCIAQSRIQFMGETDEDQQNLEDHLTTIGCCSTVEETWSPADPRALLAQGSLNTVDHAIARQRSLNRCLAVISLNLRSEVVWRLRMRFCWNVTDALWTDHGPEFAT